MPFRVGQFAPDFTLKSHDGRTVRLSDYKGKKNVVLVFFPLAWTPVWTSQIPSYQAILDKFEGMHTQVLGISVDSVPCLKAWGDSLGGITYPLLSDFYPHGQVARLYGVFRPEGYSERAIYVLDKEGCVVYVDVHDIEDQPDNDALLEVLAKLNGLPVAQPPKVTEPAPRPDADVVLYCTPWCPSCPRARALLKERGIAYVEIDISRDRDAARRIRGWANGNETTPTFDIRGTIIVDFDKTKVEDALAKLEKQP